MPAVAATKRFTRDIIQCTQSIGWSDDWYNGCGLKQLLHTIKASTDAIEAELTTTTATYKNMNNFYYYSNANSERNNDTN